MELIFKPQFLRDYDAITSIEIKSRLASTLEQIEEAIPHMRDKNRRHQEAG